MVALVFLLFAVCLSDGSLGVLRRFLVFRMVIFALVLYWLGLDLLSLCCGRRSGGLFRVVVQCCYFLICGLLPCKTEGCVVALLLWFACVDEVGVC